MIVITGNESRIDAVLERIESHPEYMHEVRADFIPPSNHERLIDSLRPHARRTILTLRTKPEGGNFEGDFDYIKRFFKDALQIEPAYIDIELRWERTLRDAILDFSRGNTNTILSAHISKVEHSSKWEPVAKELTNQPQADIIKFAAAVDDSLQIEQLDKLFKSCTKPKILIAMGAAGILSRMLYKRLGSAMCYVPVEQTSATAAGQIDLSLASMARIDDPHTKPIALLGGDHVVNSPGIPVYNALFEQHKLNYTYVPAPTQHARETINMLQRLGFVGASVTMPHKEIALSLAEEVSEDAQQIGAANTIKFCEGKLCAFNTDWMGIYLPIASRTSLKDKRVLILGGGGAARAAVYAMKRVRAHTTVAVRSPHKIEHLPIFANVRIIEWSQMVQEDFDILINTTPIGLQEQDNDEFANLFPLARQRRNLSQKVIFDAVYSKDQTPFERWGKSFGAEVIAGLEMWIYQGMKQMKILTNEEFADHEFRKFIDEAWK